MITTNWERQKGSGPTVAVMVMMVTTVEVGNLQRDQFVGLGSGDNMAMTAMATVTVTAMCVAMPMAVIAVGLDDVDYSQTGITVSVSAVTAVSAVADGSSVASSPTAMSL